MERMPIIHFARYHRHIENTAEAILYKGTIANILIIKDTELLEQDERFQ